MGSSLSENGKRLKRFLVAAVALLVAVATLFSLYALLDRYRALTGRAVAGGPGIAQASIQAVRQQLRDRVSSLEGLSLFLSPGDRLDDPRVLENIRDYNSRNPQTHLLITTPDGKCLGSDAVACEALEKDASGPARSRTTSLNGPYPSSLSNRNLAISVPIFKNGVWIGTVHSLEPLAAYARFVQSMARSDAVDLLIVRNDGRILAATADLPRDNLLDMARDLGLRHQETIRKALTSRDPAGMLSFSERINGKDSTIFFAPFFQDVSLVSSVSGIPQASVLKSAGLYLIALGTGVAALVLGLAVYLVLSRRRALARLWQVEGEREAVLDTIPGGILWTLADEEGTIVHMSQGVYTLLGYSPGEVRHLFDGKLLRLVHEDDASDVQQAFREQIAANRNIELEYRLRRKNGTWTWVIQRGRSCRRDGNMLIRSIVEDISEQKQIIEQSLISAESLRLLLDISGNSLFDLDLGRGLIAFSQQFSERYGWPQTLDHFPQSVLDDQLVAEEDTPAFLSFVDRLYDGHTSSEAEFRLREKSGQYRWVDVVAAVVFDKNNAAVKVVGKLEDIDKQKRSLEALQQQSLRDSFTGLYNKAASAHLIDEMLDRSRPGSMGALFIVDVDNFKSLNDTLGHPMGDMALKDLSAELNALFRANDIVGRLGGDEFIVYMDNVREYDNCYQKAAAVCAAFRRSYGPPSYAIKLSASVGVALYPESGTDYAALYEKADEALYEAKRGGKNRFFIVRNPELQSRFRHQEEA